MKNGKNSPAIEVYVYSGDTINDLFIKTSETTRDSSRHLS